jgi:hypothetical protein
MAGIGLFSFGSISDSVEPVFALFGGPIRWPASITSAVVATLGRLCELSKGRHKKFFLYAWKRVASSHVL